MFHCTLSKSYAVVVWGKPRVYFQDFKVISYESFLPFNLNEEPNALCSSLRYYKYLHFSPLKRLHR